MVIPGSRMTCGKGERKWLISLRNEGDVAFGTHTARPTTRLLSSGESGDGLTLDGRLVGDEGSDGSLDEARRSGEQEDGDDEGGDGASGGDNRRDSGYDEDDMSEESDAGAGRGKRN